MTRLMHIQALVTIDNRTMSPKFETGNYENFYLSHCLPFGTTGITQKKLLKLKEA